MKNKKILSGLVMVAVLLSGTTVLYFAGVERAGVTPAIAKPGGGDCGPGGWCARLDGQAGGCAFYPCCPQGQTYCTGTEYVGFPFPKYVGAPNGACMKWGSQRQLYCRMTACVGVLCPGSGCAANGAFTDQDQPIPVEAGGNCLPKE
jgi:hypothetical protein